MYVWIVVLRVTLHLLFVEIPDQKQQSVNLVQKHNSQPEMLIASVFWDKQAKIFTVYLAKRNTINAEYSVALLERLETEITKKKKRQHIWQ